MKDFKELKVWQKAHALTLAMYKETRRFPRDEQYGLTSQMRRSAASIPANIAEGCGRDGDAELARFLRIAMGSTSELDAPATRPRSALATGAELPTALRRSHPNKAHAHRPPQEAES